MQRVKKNISYGIFDVLHPIGNYKMLHKKLTVLRIFLALFFSSAILSLPLAKDKIIKQEKMSYEKCLEVIETSQNKLSVAPKVTDLSVSERIAVFELVDGTLTISCDREEDVVTVSTKTN